MTNWSLKCRTGRRYYLRCTADVADVLSPSVPFTGVDSEYSQEQLIAEITDATLWKYPCPMHVIARLEESYLDPWRKMKSAESVAFEKRRIITIEYRPAS